MNQKRKQNIPTNPLIGTTDQFLTQISQDILDVQRCLDTNAIIIKNSSNSVKQDKTDKCEDKKPKMLNNITKPENWNGFKKHTPETSESIQSNVLKEFKKADKYINRFVQSTVQKSSNAVSKRKNIISKSTPKIRNTISKSLSVLFNKKSVFGQKDLELLKKLAELKQEGILSSKEFVLKKKQILEKL